MADNLRESALDYHRFPRPGKLEVVPTKPLANQRDLALAYSPGVAAACHEIAADPANTSLYTGRANLVAVVTNGTAVLGLGAIGPYAAKPVMEGKAVLFKKFAGIDVFDIEIDERDPERLVDIIASLEPTFGGINLEDIKAPECFAIESALSRRMRIPVFHDDQHGTAIIVGAAVLNGLRVVGKKIGEIRLVTAGAGAAALACLDLLVDLGLDPDKVLVSDIAGVVYQGRGVEMDPWKERYARATRHRTLAQAIAGADVFLGLSAPDIVSADMIKTMAARPLVLALANPDPEIRPEVVRRARDDAVIATGRSDYPNQVNNVLCFPFVFRGALDVGAVTINTAMKRAAVHALAGLALAEPSEVAARAYGGDMPIFGANYILPRPFDPRLILEVAPAVARAAMESGVATRPIADLDSYRRELERFVFRSGLVMKQVFVRAQAEPKRVVYADGEEERVLRAAQVVVDEGFARPILIGRRAVVERRIAAFALRLKLDDQLELCDPENDPRLADYAVEYFRRMKRRGVTLAAARLAVRTNFPAIAAVMVACGEADALIAGPSGRYDLHVATVAGMLGLAKGASGVYGMQVLILPSGAYFILDTNVTPDPSAEQIAEMTGLAVAEVRRFGIEPKVALLSHSNFGSADTASARKMRAALALIRATGPDYPVDGEMHADSALSDAVRATLVDDSPLSGQANVLVMPSIDAANIAYNMAKTLGNGLSVGPVLLGIGAPAHVITPTVTSRGVVNMSALAVVGAQEFARQMGSR